MMGKFLIILSIFLGFKFIPKFLKNNKIHRPIVKYFDFIFICNLPLFFRAYNAQHPGENSAIA